MKGKTFFANILALVFIFHFFFEGFYKILDYKWYEIWLTTMPHINKISNLLVYLVPALQISMSLIFFIPPIRRIAFYISFWITIVFIVYLFWTFLFSIVLMHPYLTYWDHASWLQVTVFNLILSLLAFGGILLTENIPDKPAYSKISRVQQPQVR